MIFLQAVTGCQRRPNGKEPPGEDWKDTISRGLEKAVTTVIMEMEAMQTSG